MSIGFEMPPYSRIERDTLAEDFDIQKGINLHDLNVGLTNSGKRPITMDEFRARKDRLGMAPDPVRNVQPISVPPPAPPPLTPGEVAEFISELTGSLHKECDPLLAPYQKATEELARVEKIKPQLEGEIATILASASGEDEAAASRVTLLRARLELLPNNITVAEGRAKEAHEPIWRAKSDAIDNGIEGLKRLQTLYKPALKRDMARHFEVSADDDKNAAGNLADNNYHHTKFFKQLTSLEQQRPGISNSVGEIVAWLDKINNVAAQWLPIITGAN
jgi:hypothetical protein